GLVVHTDRGSEFASKDFRALLAAHGALPSMSRKADCYDNAVAESFFATLEKDLLLRTRFRTRREAIAAVNHYIQNFYNPIRKHSHNGNQSPERAEQLYAIAMRAVAA
ncbi:MAG: DDE-type integrase/transposase/recombinase, partial [Myxococcales bacterium]|nr:DDE-type integrase/transposase/recombinase [Myxococcales bacterium]